MYNSENEKINTLLGDGDQYSALDFRSWLDMTFDNILLSCPSVPRWLIRIFKLLQHD